MEKTRSAPSRFPCLRIVHLWNPLYYNARQGINSTQEQRKGLSQHHSAIVPCFHSHACSESLFKTGIHYKVPRQRSWHKRHPTFSRSRDHLGRANLCLMLKALREKGADSSFIAIFLGNRAVKPFLLPIMISYFGWIYVLILTVFTIFGSLVAGYCVGILVKENRP